MNALRMAAIGVVVGSSFSLLGASANAQGDAVNVMVRNIHLGADGSFEMDHENPSGIYAEVISVRNELAG